MSLEKGEKKIYFENNEIKQKQKNWKIYKKSKSIFAIKKCLILSLLQK